MMTLPLSLLLSLLLSPAAATATAAAAVAATAAAATPTGKGSCGSAPTSPCSADSCMETCAGTVSRDVTACWYPSLAFWSIPKVGYTSRPLTSPSQPSFTASSSVPTKLGYVGPASCRAAMHLGDSSPCICAFSCLWASTSPGRGTPLSSSPGGTAFLFEAVISAIPFSSSRSELGELPSVLTSSLNSSFTTAEPWPLSSRLS